MMTEKSNKTNTKFEEQLEIANNFNLDDCLECKLVGGGCAILIGFYVLYTGHRRHINAKHPILYRIPSVFTAASLVALGICRLTNYNPFERIPELFNKPKSEDS